MAITDAKDMGLASPSAWRGMTLAWVRGHRQHSIKFTFTCITYDVLPTFLLTFFTYETQLVIGRAWVG